VVVGGFGCGGGAGADDAVAFPSFEMDDVEHSSGSGEADRCESLFGGGGTGFDVIGIGISPLSVEPSCRFSSRWLRKGRP
jgi:hypothetical protein